MQWRRVEEYSFFLSVHLYSLVLKFLRLVDYFSLKNHTDFLCSVHPLKSHGNVKSACLVWNRICVSSASDKVWAFLQIIILSIVPPPNSLIFVVSLRSDLDHPLSLSYSSDPLVRFYKPTQSECVGVLAENPWIWNRLRFPSNPQPMNIQSLLENREYGGFVHFVISLLVWAIRAFYLWSGIFGLFVFKSERGTSALFHVLRKNYLHFSNFMKYFYGGNLRDKICP